METAAYSARTAGMTASISNAKSVTASVSGPGHPQAAQQKTRQPAAGKIAESRCSERNLRVSADRSHVEMNAHAPGIRECAARQQAADVSSMNYLRITDCRPEVFKRSRFGFSGNRTSWERCRAAPGPLKTSLQIARDPLGVGQTHVWRKNSLAFSSAKGI